MKYKFLLVVFVAACVSFTTNGQGFANKLKQKAAQAAEKALDKKAEKKVEEKTGVSTDDQNTGNNSSSSNNKGNRPTNKGGAGLVTTPPDVKQNLSDAEAAYKAGTYGEARYAVQQAMLGVEMEIGQKVLKSLPESVNGLETNTEADQVTSTGWGWAGLTIMREYNKEDKQLRTTIANNAAWMSAVNMYLANGGYAQSTNGQQNWKQVKVKNYKGIIEYDESAGYKLSVPVGQSSLIVWEGINFANEQEVLSAANTFNIDGIKNMLGEQ